MKNLVCNFFRETPTFGQLWTKNPFKVLMYCVYTAPLFTNFSSKSASKLNVFASLKFCRVPKANHRRYALGRAFTLIEVMVVVVILAILAAIIVPKILERPEEAKVVAAKQDILAITNAMALYKLDNGFYPSTAQGIKALVVKPTIAPIPQNWQAGGYLQKVPVDPWGHPYHYANPGKHGTIDVWTDGRDNKPDGPTVIGNWMLGQ